MKDCTVCFKTLTTIEMANCLVMGCPMRTLAMKGHTFPKPRRTDPTEKATYMTIREYMATEFVKSRLVNEDMYKRHGANHTAVAQDAVSWADALIDRLNGVIPPGESTGAKGYF